MNNKGADQIARMRRLVCACVVRKPPKTGFLLSRPIYYKALYLDSAGQGLKKLGNSLMEVPYLELIYDALENIGALKSSTFICQCQHL